ncbi:hinge connector of long tail fiber protein distal connector [Enterobacteria phage RB18]|uniref:Hinge connector of long tail fiber distal connector n=1 Tax=Enterobacteria phage RB18 TaxID=10692 RepID=A0A345AZM6_BPR18|nr:hinge connector of long tail fiber protein distal connector [Enterobacteria phage RB18]AXF42556.1 hinge connector of long tail fiber distal connector [Enterobacteria phage RB18]
MADLKVGSTTGGSVIWHQGNFPLNPAGDDVLYKSFKIYSEYNKPQAADNDFVSKANGGTYASKVTFNAGVQVPYAINNTNQCGIYPGNGDNATFAVANIDIVSWNGIGFKSSQGSAERTVVINARNGDISTKGVVTAVGQIRSNAVAPIAANDLTRKDYVDGAINTVTANANSRVLRSGDIMTGNLTAPNFFSQNPASQPSHVPRFDQIVIKDSVQDFGYY